MKTEKPSFPNLSLRDLLDIPALQDLSESFNRLTGIPTAILDLDGNVLTACGWQPICTEFHRKNKISAERCLESDTVLAGQVANGEKYTLYRCKNGLVDVAAPISIEDVHIGNIFIGQFFLEPPDIDFFSMQAEKYGFDKTAYLNALSGVPLLSLQQIQRATDFLTDLTAFVCNAGKAKLELHALNKNLEERIEIRTSDLQAEIKARKKTEKDLHTSKTFLDSVFNAIQDGISVLDKDLTILRVNKTICDWYPQLPESIGEKCYRIYHGNSKPCKKCPAVRALKSGKMEMAEVPYTIEGDVMGTQELFSFPILDPQGKVKGIVEYIRDITERKAIEEQIRMEKNFSESLINSLPGIMYVLDSSKRMLRWNKNAEVVSGYSAERIRRLNPLDLIVGEDKARVEKSIERGFLEGSTTIEAGLRTSDGKVIPHLFTGYKLDQGSKSYLVGIGLDISGRVEVEKEKEALINQLKDTLSQVKQLSGLLPICAACKKIRDDKGYWNQIESYIKKHSEANFSHGLCPECARKLYPDLKLWKKLPDTE